MDKNQFLKLKNRATKQKDRYKSHETTKPPEKDYQKLRPIFDIRCDHHKHCLEKYGNKVKANFARTIHKMGQLTWEKIETLEKRGLGYEKIPFSQIKVTHKISLSPDEKIKIFRLTDKERMAGVRFRNEIFTILWIAPKHDLY